MRRPPTTRAAHGVWWAAAMACAVVGPGGGCARPRAVRLGGGVPTPAAPEVVLRAAVRGGAHGTVVVDESDGLTPVEAALLAVGHNPALAAQRARRGVARAEVVAAHLLPNPALEGEVSAPLGGPDARAAGFGVGLGWRIDPLWWRGAREEAARQRAQSVDLEVAWAEWQVAMAARLHAIRLLYLDRQREVALEATRAWRAQAQAHERAHAAGADTAIAVARARRSAAQWRLRCLDFERQAIAERAALAQALGVEPDEVPRLDARWHPREQAEDAAALLAALPDRRLDAVALRHAQRAGSAAVRAAALSRFAPVELGVRFSQEVDGVRAAGFAVRVGLPFFDRNQAAIARASTRREQVRAELAARLAQARAQVWRSASALDVLRGQLQAARNARDAAVRLARLMQRAAQAGSLDASLAADAQDAAFEARLRALRVEAAYAEVQVALSLASGTLVPRSADSLGGHTPAGP